MFGAPLGAPIIQNFNSKIYDAQPQNWVAVQDRRGVMYFGNGSGILEYDGARWRLIQTPNRTIIRGLALGSDGTLYYGAIADFGYLAANASGEIEAISLKHLIPESDRAFNDIWQVISVDDGIYFFCDAKIFRFHQAKISIVQGKYGASNAAVLNGNLLYFDEDHGLSVIDGEKSHALSQFKHIDKAGKIFMAPIEQHALFLVRNSGEFFKLDLKEFWQEDRQRYVAMPDVKGSFLEKIPSEIAPMVTEDKASIYRLVAITPKRFAIATIKAGVVIVDDNGKFIRNINRSNGLVDNLILDLFVDRQNNLWVSTNTGISYLEYSVPQSYYGIANGIDGMILSAYEYQDKVYVGTHQGVLVEAQFQVSDPLLVPKFKPVKNSDGSGWQLMQVDGDLLAAGTKGLVSIKNDIARSAVDSIADGGYSLGVSKKWPKHVFMGAMGGLFIFQHVGEDWVFVDKLADITDNIRSISEDEQGDLWLSTEVSGILSLRFNQSTVSDVTIQYYGKNHGLPSTEGLIAKIINGQLFVSAPDGLYRAENVSDPNGIRFIPDPNFSKLLNMPFRSVYGIISGPSGGYLASVDNEILWMVRDESRKKYFIKNGPFQGIGTWAEHVLIDTKGSTWIPMEGLTRVEPNAEKDYTQSFDVLIRKLLVQNKRTVFDGVYAKMGVHDNAATVFESFSDTQMVATLPYEDNDIVFEFSAAYYEKPKYLLFRFIMEGFDKQWSDWSALTSKEYSNLPFGSYQFRVQAKNVYATEGKEASYGVVITPPWYLTYWAVFIWMALAVSMLILIVKMYTIKLKKEKFYLEWLVDQRTQELREASLTDPLTGLRNRRFISEVLEGDISAFSKYKAYMLSSESQRSAGEDEEVFGVFVLDLDYFKKINDDYGHKSGDKILQQFSRVLLSIVREDDVVVRLGGEEFLIVLKKTKVSYLHEFSKKLLRSIYDTDFEIENDVAIHETCSIGYASYPFDLSEPEMLTLEEMIMLVDMAMYFGKDKGRNCAVFVEPGSNWPVDRERYPRAFSSIEFTIENHYLKFSKQE